MVCTLLYLLAIGALLCIVLGHVYLIALKRTASVFVFNYLISDSTECAGKVPVAQVHACRTREMHNKISYASLCIVVCPTCPYFGETVASLQRMYSILLAHWAYTGRILSIALHTC